MRFQLLRHDANGTPTCPCDMATFPGLAFNATEDRYEMDLDGAADLLNLARHENVHVLLLDTSGGDPAVDLPLIELIEIGDGAEGDLVAHVAKRAPAAVALAADRETTALRELIDRFGDAVRTDTQMDATVWDNERNPEKEIIAAHTAMEAARAAVFAALDRRTHRLRWLAARAHRAWTEFAVFMTDLSKIPTTSFPDALATLLAACGAPFAPTEPVASLLPLASFGSVAEHIQRFETLVSTFAGAVADTTRAYEWEDTRGARERVEGKADAARAALIAAFCEAADARVATKAKQRSDMLPNSTATASHRLTELANGCCLDEPDERDHAANVVVQHCIDTLDRAFVRSTGPNHMYIHGEPVATLADVVAVLQKLKQDVDSCTHCEENGVPSC